MTIIDAQERLTALNPEQSFIVQAPAGSGKTELLTQRYLRLLGTIERQTEEILAITFTRKAAGEMRHRIVAALKRAATEPMPINEHEAQTWRLAKHALEHTKSLGLNVFNNPHGLRIQTIDSLSSYFTRQLPVLSQLGAAVQISESAEIDYEASAKKLLTYLENGTALSKDISNVLLHLNNDLSAVKELLIEMLKHREQWLPHIVNARQLKQQDDLRPKLESILQTIISEHLTVLSKAFSNDQKERLLNLFNFSAEQRGNETLETFPTDNIHSLSSWLALVNLLLTQSNDIRKKITKNEGFPPEFKDHKIMMQDFLLEIQDNPNIAFLLSATRKLPASVYSDKEWEILSSLIELLIHLVMELKVIFKEQGHIDFIENSCAALDALGDPFAPSDFALYLDHKIKHLLVDEFQDTSIMQFQLLEHLTRGWQAGDGRTLFLVGDPMQSIYRFRAAEVGLFLQAKQFGLGQISLESLTLKTNFRSSETLVTWFNLLFKNLFPKQEDIRNGAIRYAPATANHTTLPGKIIAYQHEKENIEAQAHTIAQIIRETKQSNHSIAILVKARSHLKTIIPYLKKEGIAYQAVEIEKFSELSVIDDLLALTKALIHFGDRLAWLCILRAPPCGLLLTDLLLIAQEDKKTIWESLNDSIIQQKLSHDGQQRIQRFIYIISPILASRGRKKLSNWSRDAWTCLQYPAALQDAENFFELLQNFNIESFDEFEKKLVKSYAASTHENNAVQIMTIHKAKGLEFDTVILPLLEKTPKADKNKLLRWQERPGLQDDIEFLLAPIHEYGKKENTIYEHLKDAETKKSDYESTRLLYVAITRAKQYLYLLASFDDSKEKPEISGNHFLSKLAPYVNEWKKISNSPKKLNENHLPHLYRLPIHFTPPSFIENVPSLGKNIPLRQDDFQAKVGSIIHAILQRISDTHQPITPTYIRNLCIFYEIQATEISIAYERVQHALQMIQKSSKAQWILNRDHQEAVSEYAVTLRLNNENDKFQSFIMDRTFIEEGIRWIIDYKTSQPLEQESHQDFMARERQHYQRQLEQYAAYFASKNLPIKLALYFPMIDAWIEWEYNH